MVIALIDSWGGGLDGDLMMFLARNVICTSIISIDAELLIYISENILYLSYVSSLKKYISYLILWVYPHHFLYCHVPFAYLEY